MHSRFSVLLALSIILSINRHNSADFLFFLVISFSIAKGMNYCVIYYSKNSWVKETATLIPNSESSSSFLSCHRTSNVSLPSIHSSLAGSLTVGGCRKNLSQSLNFCFHECCQDQKSNEYKVTAYSH